MDLFALFKRRNRLERSELERTTDSLEGQAKVDESVMSSEEEKNREKKRSGRFVRAAAVSLIVGLGVTALVKGISPRYNYAISPDFYVRLSRGIAEQSTLVVVKDKRPLLESILHPFDGRYNVRTERVNGIALITSKEPSSWVDTWVRPLTGEYEFKKGQLIAQNIQFNLPRYPGADICPFRFRVLLNGKEIFDLDARRKPRAHWIEFQLPPYRNDSIAGLKFSPADSEVSNDFTLINSVNPSYDTGSDEFVHGINYLETEAHFYDGGIQRVRRRITLTGRPLNEKERVTRYELHRQYYTQRFLDNLTLEVKLRKQKEKGPSGGGSSPFLPLG